MLLQEILALNEPIEPETLDRVEPSLTKLEREQVLALRAIKTTGVVFDDMDVFENAVYILNNISPEVLKMETPSPEMIWRALITLGKMKPDFKLSWEVRSYIKYVFNDEGFIFFPPLSGIENPHFSKVQQIAKDGPFPLTETPENIQAMRYLKVQNYLRKV